MPTEYNPFAPHDAPKAAAKKPSKPRAKKAAAKKTAKPAAKKAHAAKKAAAERATSSPAATREGGSDA